MVMRHNLFLHSALVLSRKIPRSASGIQEACRFYMIECGFALTIAFLINVSVISVSGWSHGKEKLESGKPAFKALGKLILDVGLLVAYHCDRYGIFGLKTEAMDT